MGVCVLHTFAGTVGVGKRGGTGWAVVAVAVILLGGAGIGIENSWGQADLRPMRDRMDNPDLTREYNVNSRSYNGSSSVSKKNFNQAREFYYINKVQGKQFEAKSFYAGKEGKSEPYFIQKAGEGAENERFQVREFYQAGDQVERKDYNTRSHYQEDKEVSVRDYYQSEEEYRIKGKSQKILDEQSKLYQRDSSLSVEDVKRLLNKPR